ncbi:hypothetical protein TNCV_447141, partial [Trichonephila clavipes]
TGFSTDYRSISSPYREILSTTRSEMGTPSPPPSPDDRNMDFSSSDSEEEQMETLLASKMNVSPSPHLLLLRSRILKRNTRASKTRPAAPNLLSISKGLMTSLDNYVFVNAAEKDRYYTGLMKIFKEEHRIARLRSAELDRLNAAIQTIDMNHGIPSKNNPSRQSREEKGTEKPSRHLQNVKPAKAENRRRNRHVQQI